jgi:threonine synthase
MKYYSTNHEAPLASLKDAVVRGLAPDGGLYMPQSITRLPDAFFNNMSEMTLPEIAFMVADTLFGDDIEPEQLKRIVYDTLSFEIPLKKVEDNIYVLELFHGPTLAFKDVGARFMARMLGYFNNLDNTGTVNVLVATSGDTGSAVANGFLNVPGVHVYVLYPKGKVSKLQEMQFATLGANITALEIDGTFDDCQAMVKQAFVDQQLNKAMKLTSANSINPARFLPQMFYYFGAIAQLQKQLGTKSLRSLNAVVSVPSGNLGNICSALIGARMGLPISRFVAANNANDVFTQYLNSGEYSPRPSVQTIANAMDVGAPSNFARIMDLYQSNHGQVASVIAGRRYSDDEIRNALREVEQRTGYQLDPHGATAYMALKDELKPGENGIFLETAHPAKFKETVESAIGQQIDAPERLAKFMERKKQSIYMPATFSALKKFLLTR